MKKLMAVSLLVAFAFVFSSVGAACAADPDDPDDDKVPVRIYHIRTFRLAHLNGNPVPPGGTVEVTPGHTVSLHVIDATYDYHVVYVTREEADTMSPTVGIASTSSSQLGGRVSLYYSPRNPYSTPFETYGLVTIRETSYPESATATMGTVSVQLDTAWGSGTSSLGTAYYSDVRYIFVRVIDDDGKAVDGSGGGTCDVAGLGSLALLLPVISLIFIRKRKK